MNSPRAPIALFAYKRPEMTRQVLESLQACAGADSAYLKVYLDGPKRPEDKAAVDAVRDVVLKRKWCGKVDLIQRPTNWGLSRSIRTGVGELCQEFGKVIVLEDDLILHPSFLEFMNHALEKYENNSRVMQITAYQYPVSFPHLEADSFFVCHSSCWGWGTWKRAWDLFDDSPRFLEKLKTDENLRKSFDAENSYPYFEILKKQYAGEIDSWGILWYQTLFENRGLILMPKETLVRNQGAGIQGTHENPDGYHDVLSKKEMLTFPAVVEDQVAAAALSRFLGEKTGHGSWQRRAWIRLKRVLRKALTSSRLRP